jgi:hypothetical protein
MNGEIAKLEVYLHQNTQGPVLVASRALIYSPSVTQAPDENEPVLSLSQAGYDQSFCGSPAFPPLRHCTVAFSNRT